MRSFTKLAAVGVFAAAVCVFAAFNAVPNGDNVGVYSNRNPQKNEKAVETVGKSDLLYVVGESGDYYKVVTKTGSEGWIEKRLTTKVIGVADNYRGENWENGRRYGGCCSRYGNLNGNRQQNYGEYDCH
jgi:hypothetical protein